MKLITEQITDVSYVVEEKESGKKSFFITGPFMVANEANLNGRIYPLEVMAEAVNKYLKEKVQAGRAFGELGHPSGPSINLDRVSHIITELKQEGNRFVGRAKLTETPMGGIARGLMESGATLGVSSRGMGSLQEKNGVMYVQPDYFIATAADIVADPSAPGAFVQGIMEGVEWIMDPKAGWKAIEIAEKMRTQMRASTAREINEKKVAFFEQYIRTIV
jgi:hypothetical protein